MADGGKAAREHFLPKGRPNPLKRLIPDKRIQAFSFDLFCSVLPGLGWLWENLENGLDRLG
jgi:hypothetical protein